MGHLGHKIKLIDRQFRSRMDKNLENLGITTAQMNVLCYMEHLVWHRVRHGAGGNSRRSGRVCRSMR